MTGRPRPARLLLALLATVPLMVACASQRDGNGPAAPAPGSSDGQSEVAGEITVFAAASLTESFTTIGEQFETAHPDASVTFNFGPSSGLAQQIVSGAPVDVFAAASPATMQTVVDAGAAGDPRVFVANTLQIAVPPDNPGEVSGLGDLADPERTIALCAVEVPCGAAAEKVFDSAGLTPAPDTYENDVKAALSKVVLGEVDAALVYRTDVMAAGDDVVGIDFPESSAAVNDYPIAVLTEAPEADAAQAFVEHVGSPPAQEVLEAAGFQLPG